MADTYRVAFIGLVHDHAWGELPHWLECPNCQVVAAADPNSELTQRAQAKGVPSVYSDWREMAEAEEFEIAAIFVPNSDAAEVVEALAPRGVHFVVEKPMAARLAQADRMLAAVRAANVELLINWPIAWRPTLYEAHRRLVAGEVGHPFYMNVYMGHQGPKEIGCSEYFYSWLYDATKNGAGALMDYCCYGAALANWWFGRPTAVQAVAGLLTKDYLTVEDNAIITLLYPNLFVETQGSWSTVPGHHDMVLRGDAGTLYTSESYHTLHIAVGNKPFEEVAAPSLPEHQSNAAHYLTWCLREGRPVEGFCSAQVGRDAQEVLEAGLLSASQCRRLELPLS
ncbi:MAG: Gfo/Idh/MocA family protein [Armatimonadota bacterium]